MLAGGRAGRVGQDLGAAQMHLRSARRTCDLIFGVGDGKSGAFRSVQYSASVANFFTDTDMLPVADWHPRMDNVVYYGWSGSTHAREGGWLPLALTACLPMHVDRRCQAWTGSARATRPCSTRS